MEGTTMKKKYIQPIIYVVNIRNQQQLMTISSVNTCSTSDDVNLNYDSGGGDAGDAW
jgi:hypothetical protein